MVVYELVAGCMSIHVYWSFPVLDAPKVGTCNLHACGTHFKPVILLVHDTCTSLVPGAEGRAKRAHGVYCMCIR